MGNLEQFCRGLFSGTVLKNDLGRLPRGMPASSPPLAEGLFLMHSRISYPSSYALEVEESVIWCSVPKGQISMDLWQENMVRDKESHWHVKLPEGFLWANKSWVLRLPLKHMDLLLPQLSSLVWTGHHLEESTFTKKFTIRWLV